MEERSRFPVLVGGRSRSSIPRAARKVGSNRRAGLTCHGRAGRLTISDSMSPVFSVRSWRVALLSLDDRETVLLDAAVGQGFPTDLYPSPDGRYLGYGLRLYEGNVVLLENY
jgi:hypothetical protein